MPMNPTTRSARIRPRPEQAPVEGARTRAAIVGGWFRDESFYRDIATRFLSVALTGAVTYLAAVALGYVGKPSGQASYSLAWAVGTGIVMVALAYALISGRDGLTLAIVSFAGAACLAGTWYGPIWFGDFGWKDKWNWIAMALQITLIVISVVFVRRRVRRTPRVPR